MVPSDGDVKRADRNANLLGNCSDLPQHGNPGVVGIVALSGDTKAGLPRGTSAFGWKLERRTAYQPCDRPAAHALRADADSPIRAVNCDPHALQVGLELPPADALCPKALILSGRAFDIDRQDAVHREAPHALS